MSIKLIRLEILTDSCLSIKFGHIQRRGGERKAIRQNSVWLCNSCNGGIDRKQIIIKVGVMYNLETRSSPKASNAGNEIFSISLHAPAIEGNSCWLQAS